MQKLLPKGSEVDGKITYNAPSGITNAHSYVRKRRGFKKGPANQKLRNGWLIRYDYA